MFPFYSHKRQKHVLCKHMCLNNQHSQQKIGFRGQNQEFHCFQNIQFKKICWTLVHVKSLAWSQYRPALLRTNRPRIFSKNAKTTQRKLQKFKYFLRPFGHFGLVDKFGKAIKKSIDLFKNGRPMRSFHVSRRIFQVWFIGSW